MIQSLRNRLRELEHWTGQQAEQRVQTTHNPTMAQENAQPDPSGPFATAVHEQEGCAEAEDSIVVADQAQDGSGPVNPTLTPRGVAVSPPPAPLETNTGNLSTDSHLPAMPAGSVQPPLAATTYGSPSGSSGRIEPNSVERLMRPIDQAITQTSPRGIGVRPAASRVASPCSCDRLLGAGHWSLPIRRQADDLVHLYFSRVHRIYPILHQPTFMKQYRLLWESAPADASIPAHCSGLCKQKSLDKTFPATVNAVFALASLFGPRPMAQNSARAGVFFNMTQQIDLLDIIDEEVGIELVQLLLLMGYYLQSTERFSKCWNITGLAIRMAQNMGLQLSPSDARRKGLLAACPTQLESEMRIRVWYGCVLLDREISMSFGRPVMINTTTGSEQPRLPEAIDDEHLSEVAGGKWNSQPGNCPSLLASYIQTIKLYDILGQVLDREELKDGMMTPNRLPHQDKLSRLNSDTQSLLDLDTMIMEWRDSLPPYLQYDPSVDMSREDRGLTPDSIPPTDFSAQAKRLHARYEPTSGHPETMLTIFSLRFLHVRVLILRPALEHLFQKQRDLQLSEGKASSPRVTRIQDLMLSDIAAQCVLSADSLVRCLDAHIRSQSLVAWWYNIGCKYFCPGMQSHRPAFLHLVARCTGSDWNQPDLHTCGSTLLMGRLCTFNDAVLKQKSLATSWDLCLQSLSRYTGLSSIADKSVHLLQGSSRRLLPNQEKVKKKPKTD